MSPLEKLQALVGQTVEFLPKISEQEVYADAGIRAIVTGVFVENDEMPEPQDQVYGLHVDYAPFDAHNLTVEPRCWRMKDTEESGKTMREAGYYEPQETLYVGGEGANVGYYFNVLDKEAVDRSVLLRGVHAASGSTRSYVTWLEAAVTPLVTFPPEADNK